jgi:outer membrane protein assembly factor BamB
MNSQPSLPPPIRRAASVALLLCAAAFLCIARAQTHARSSAQSSASASQEIETTLRWDARPGVTRYRLQVALDPRFNDIVYDGAVNGLEQKVPLAPGRYYWRVAPAPKETGRYSTPVVVEVTTASASSSMSSPTRTTPTPRVTPSPRVLPTPRLMPTPRVSSPSVSPSPVVSGLTRLPLVPAILRPPANVGWETATGSVDRAIPARLRAGQPFDFVTVNSDGTVYALEGATGAALWTARFVPGRQTSATNTAANSQANGGAFTPLVVPASQRETANVLVAFDGGVRLLEGETGRELWRASVKGRAASGCVAELDNDPTTPEIAVATEYPSALYVLNAASGNVVSHAMLEGDIVGVPIPFQQGAERGVALSLKGAQLDIRKADGERLRAVKFDVPFVTPPLVIAGPRGTLVVVGTEHGLLLLNGDLHPLGRISTEDDAPHGRLAAADLDGNGGIEIVMVTTNGRIAVISAEGKINWSAQGARGAYTPAFADLNHDGVLDVLAADEGVFARGFSGRDGTIIWQADDEPKSNAAPPSTDQSRALRSLAVAAGDASTPLVVSGDHARRALRAVGLPAGSVKVAAK